MADIILNGFVYEAASQPSRVNSNITSPPCIVVDHCIEAVVVTSWPGKLWRVAMLEAATEQPLPSARYSRATSVNMIEELPLELLFGGKAKVCQILDSASCVTLNEVQALANCFNVLGVKHSNAALRAYSKAWDCWLDAKGSTAARGNHQHTLSIGGSPAGCAFSLVCAVLRQKARSIDPKAFMQDDEGEECFSAVWSAACSAFLCAIMGAVEVCSYLKATEARCLMQAWNAVYDNP